MNETTKTAPKARKPRAPRLPFGPQLPPLAKREPTGRMIPCPGEAHSNAWIDNCMICAPEWGTVPEYAPIDIEAAYRDGLDVRACDVPEGWAEDIRHDYRIPLVDRTVYSKGGSTTFTVYRLAYLRK